MRLGSLRIENFRGVTRLELSNLGDVVVLAGPNGSGKSAVLDAIRLLKSTYGGYHPDEWRHWFGEFQIDLARPEQLVRLKRDPNERMVLAAVMHLADGERQYLDENADALVEELAWKQVMGPSFDYRSYLGGGPLAAEMRSRQEQVRGLVAMQVQQLRAGLEAESFAMDLSMGSEFQLKVEPSPVLDAVLRHYDPQHIGVIEYHSASRAYQRSAVGGINLDVHQFEEQKRQQVLYNWQGKFQNIKTELASHYLQSLIVRDADPEADTGEFEDLNATIRELFNAFLPGKTYEGPRPTAQGTLEFPVRLASGAVHDIDDLSSGEKEIVYGYLRLRNSAPKNSIILFDEPELHLNPSLLQGLPDFYHQHLGARLNNQIWLVTHSDAILRQAVGHTPYSVFHMRSPASMEPGGEQAVAVTLESEVERAVVDLVGDLAAYKPNANVVILEGGGDTEFDRNTVARLFPTLAAKANLVSGGSKSRVRDLYSILSEASGAIGLGRFFAIVDRDRDVAEPEGGASILHWDRYHIENYLLEPDFVFSALRAAHPEHSLGDATSVRAALRFAAAEMVDKVVLTELRASVNAQLIGSFALGADPDAPDAVEALRPSIDASMQRVNDVAARLAADPGLDGLAQTIREEVEGSLEQGTWETEIPGRLILSRFVHQHVAGVRYEQFRNLIVNEMVEAGFEPPGMKTVVETILNA